MNNEKINVPTNHLDVLIARDPMSKESENDMKKTIDRIVDVSKKCNLNFLVVDEKLMRKTRKVCYKVAK